MVYNIEWANTNKLRGHPFVSENKLLPLIDLYIVVPSGATTVHISEVLADGIVFSVDNIPYAKSPVAHYTSIINRPNSIFKIGSTGELLPDAIGYLIADAEVAFPQEFTSTETAIIPTLCIYENPGGVKRIFIRNTDGTLTKLKQNIIFEAGRNMVIDRDGNKIRFSNITTPDYSNYVKGLEIDGEVANDDGIFIFGRNIVKVRGVDFSTIIENADANCPTRFPDALRGGPGSDGDPGFTGQPGDPGLITCGGCGCFDCPCCGEEDLIFCCGEDDTCLEYDLDCCTPFTDINDLCCCPETEQCCIEGDFCPEGDFVNTNGGTAPKVGPPPNCILGDNAPPPPPPPPPPPAGGPCPIDIDALENFDEDKIFTTPRPRLRENSDLRRTGRRHNVDVNGGQYVTVVEVQTVGDKIEEDTNLVFELEVEIMPLGGDINLDRFSHRFFFLDAVVENNSPTRYKVDVFKPGPNTPKDDLFTYMVDIDCKPCLFYDTWVTPNEGTSDGIEKKVFVIYENGDRFEVVNTRFSGWDFEGNNAKNTISQTRPKIRIYDQDFEYKTTQSELDVNLEFSSAVFGSFHEIKGQTETNGSGGIGEFGLVVGGYGTLNGAVTKPLEDVSVHRMHYLGGWFNDVEIDETFASVWDISTATGSVWEELVPDTQATAFAFSSVFEESSEIEFPNMNFNEHVTLIKTREYLIANTLFIDRIHKVDPEIFFNSSGGSSVVTTETVRVPMLRIRPNSPLQDVLSGGLAPYRRYRIQMTRELVTTLFQNDLKVGYWLQSNPECTLATRKMTTAPGDTAVIEYIVTDSGVTSGRGEVLVAFGLPDSSTLAAHLPRTLDECFTIDGNLEDDPGLVYGPESDLVGDTHVDVFMQVTDGVFRSGRYVNIVVDTPLSYNRWDWELTINRDTGPNRLLIERDTTTTHHGFDFDNLHEVSVKVVDDSSAFSAGVSAFHPAMPGTPEFVADSGAISEVFISNKDTILVETGEYPSSPLSIPYDVYLNDRMRITKLTEKVNSVIVREREFDFGDFANNQIAIVYPASITHSIDIGNDSTSTTLLRDSNTLIVSDYFTGFANSYNLDDYLTREPVFVNLEFLAIGYSILSRGNSLSSGFNVAAEWNRVGNNTTYVRDPSGTWALNPPPSNYSGYVDPPDPSINDCTITVP